MVRTVAVLVLLATLASFTSAARADGSDAERRALDWLVDNLWDQDDALRLARYDTTGSGKRWCAKAVTAFVLESHPDRERFARARTKLETELLRALEAEPSVPQRTWLLGFIGLWLAEKGLQGDDVATHYESLLRQLGQSQNPEGGWAHAAWASPAIYPTTLIAATNWALLANGTARRLGVKVDEDGIARAVAMLEAVQGDTGAFPYGGPTCRKGYEAGRTAGCVVALAALGGHDTETFQRAADYILRDPAAVPRGHASPSMHVLMGSLAFQLLGDDAWQRWDEKVLRGICNRQRKSGIFDILVTRQSVGRRDRASDLYASACCAAALAMPRTRLAATLAAAHPVPTEVALPIPCSLATLWSVEVPASARLAAGGGRAVLCSVESGLESIAAMDGTVRYAADLPLDDPGALRVKSLAVTPTRTYVMLQGPNLAQGGFQVLAFGTTDGSLVWNHEFEHSPRVIRMSATHLYLTTFAGEVFVIDLATGKEARRIAWPRPMPNFWMDVGPQGRLIRTYEWVLSLHAPDGEQVWERKVDKPAKDINRPPWSSVVWLRDRVVAGRDDGVLEAVAPDDGRTLWSTPAGTGIAYLQRVGPDGPVLVLDSLGTVRLVSGADGSELWRFELPHSKECVHPGIPTLQDGMIVVPSPGDERTFVLDLVTGRVCYALRTSRHAQVAVTDGVIFVLDHGRLWALQQADPR